MSGRRALAVVAVVGLAAFAVMAYARTQSLQAPEEEGSASLLGGLDWSAVGALADPISAAFDELQTEVTMNGTTLDPSANARAFLDVVKRSEGTPDAGGYACLYGSSPSRPVVFSNFTDHPYLTGEWPGVRLSDVQCGGAGLSPGCITTAAGAYQMTKSTWARLRDRLSLPDFSPASQDAAALQLLKDCGAYSKLAAGDLPGAVAAARRTWASLPGANFAGQGMRSMSQVAQWYGDSGGAVA
jgi:lysozyme